MEKYDVIIVGAGLAGSVLAREFANDGKRVLVIEKRHHIGGNAYEEVMENDVRVHLYGPHIFHTSNSRVFEYVKKYAEWYFYEHRVLGKINGILVPIPFNFKSLELLFDKNDCERIKNELISSFPNDKKVSILDLVNHENVIIRDFGKFVYKNVFENYTAKQWNIPVDKIDKSVINRVPVILGYDDRYFQDDYQFMPKNGFNELFNNLLNHELIDVRLNTDAKDIINIQDDKILFYGRNFDGKVIYTGAPDELLDYKYGPLPYRSLDLKFENIKMNYYQPSAVINYPNEEKYTRITEFKYLTNEQKEGCTTILKEYPLTYNHKDKSIIPYYVISNENNLNLYKKYLSDINDVPNLYLCGRLAEYKYYNMDAVIDAALNLHERICKE